MIGLSGKTVMLGLIDTHVRTVMMDSECLPLFLPAGVATALDVGGRLDLVLKNRDDINSGKKLGPHLFVDSYPTGRGPVLKTPTSPCPPTVRVVIDYVDKLVPVTGHLGDRPDWDIIPGFYDNGAGSMALEKQQQIIRMLYECGGQ
ncbi:MAG: hypothetical protein AB9Q22_14160 [Candidatus Reddybacter sp.]